MKTAEDYAQQALRFAQFAGARGGVFYDAELSRQRGVDAGKMASHAEKIAYALDAKKCAQHSAACARLARNRGSIDMMIAYRSSTCAFAERAAWCAGYACA